MNRKHNALLQLRVIEQRPTQTVRDVVAAIEELEKDIPPMTLEETKAWTLLTALHPDTRTEVLKENKTISSRDQVIASAQRQEELRKAKDKGKEKASDADDPSDKPNARMTHAFRSRGRGRSMSNSNDRSDKANFLDKGNKYQTGISCYNCGKMGHFQKDCRSPRKKDAASALLASKN